jgi:hypothetical protein
LHLELSTIIFTMFHTSIKFYQKQKRRIKAFRLISGLLNGVST